MGAMKNKNGKFFKKSLYLLIMIFFIIVVAFAIVICKNLISENKQKIKESVNREAEQLYIVNEKIMGEAVTQMKRLMNLDIFSAVYDDSVSERLYYNLCNDAVKYLKNITDVNADIDSIYFFCKNKEEIITNSGTVRYDLFNDKSWEKEYEKMGAEELKAFFRDGANGKKVFTFLYKNASGESSDRSILINIDIENLLSSVSKNGIFAIITNDTNEIISINYEKNRQIAEKIIHLDESGIVQYEGERYGITTKQSDYGNFSYLYIGIFPEYFGNNIKIFIQMGGILFFLIVFFIFVAFWVANYTYKPIKDLGEIIDSPDLSESRKYLENDENTKKIVDKIFNIVYKNEALCRELNEKMENFNYAQLKALQYQINPHFIFNTLNVLYLLSENHAEKSSNITDGILSFSKIMRYSLKTESMIVPLREELNLANEYINLMAIRLGDTFDFEVICDEELKSRTVIKMCIQPLLENIFRYGIKGLDRRAHIKIEISEAGECLKIEISDNGYGMTDEKLKEIRQSLKKKPKISDVHIGLLNTNSRLVLLYGEEYALKLESSENIGTKVTILCPENYNKNTKTH